MKNVGRDFPFTPLTPELPQLGVPDPELPHNIICNSFFQNFRADILSLREYIKDLQAGISALREFVMVGEAGFSALWGERVKACFRSLLHHLTRKGIQLPGPTPDTSVN